jgi:two-component system cell cycle sensor histidine kinase/response regulator CckA
VVKRTSRANRPLHVLLVEDSAADANLILDELRRGGYEPVARRVTSRVEMLDALSDGFWQVVLLDYSVLGEEMLDTLTSLAQHYGDVPAILISGAIGEDDSANALRAGARDFVSKGHLTRLVSAVDRELDQVEQRGKQRDDEQALSQSQQRLRLALAAGGMGSWEWDLATDRLHWSEELECLFGLEPGAFGGTYAEFIGLVHPADRELVRASIEEAIGHDSPAVVYRAQWPDGTVRWHERKSQRTRDESGGSSQVMAGVTFDVTEREEAAQTLRASEDRFRLIAEHARDLIALLDADGRYRYLSPSCESLLGYPDGALLGTIAAKLIHPDDWPTGWSWGSGKLREMRMRKVDGSWLWVEGSSCEITGRAESQFAVIVRDISERKAAEVARELLEDELRHSQKMEAVGLLAGGIAHDFNNLLTVISGYTEILLRRLGREAEGSKEIGEVSKAAERAARLTRQLLAYSRKQVLEARALDLNALVTETHAMLARVIGDNIECSTALTEDLGNISADEGQIEQIVVNLVVNARDAMPEGGTLLLETRNVTRADGEYAVLAVTDTGVGMSAATVARIFEPFYTTKERGAGTGLGLSTVYGIVKQSGGQIEVESEPGIGTTFRVFLPLVPEVAAPFSPKALDARPLAGTETVLLVEDEEALRGLGREILESYGYTVLLACDGEAGLALALRHPEPIELLMTDILMPKMGGIELADRLSRLRPELKILYTSGYNDSGGSPDAVAGARYLPKPYAMEDLARALRDLLDAAEPVVIA